MDSWSYGALRGTSLIIRVVDEYGIFTYQSIDAQENKVVVVVPPERLVLVSAKAHGYLPTAASFLVHHHKGPNMGTVCLCVCLLPVLCVLR